MEDSSPWSAKPTRVVKPPSSRPYSAKVRYTWAGPFDPQIYSDELNHLSKTTEANIKRLEFVRQRPQTAHGRVLRPSKSVFAGSSWHDSGVMFAPRDALDSVTTGSTMADDASSIASVSYSTNFCYLCSTLEEHQKHMLRMRVPRKSTDIRKPRIRYIAPPPRVRPKVEEEPQQILDARYKVIVWTGDVPGATSDVNVYVTIKGTENVLDKTRLSRGNANQKVVFCRKSKEAFFIKSPYLGNLEILSIEIDGLEKKHAWYCEKVEVICLRTHRHWMFLCKNWLSLHHGDYSIRRDLLANYKERKTREFELTVITGKKRMAGTDANVFVTFFGTEGSTPKIHLTSQHKSRLFEKGSEDKFPIRFRDVGEIKTMRIEHDGKGLASGWFLDRAILQSTEHSNVIYYFLLNGWLAKDVGVGHLWREIRAKKKLAKEITTASGRRILIIPGKPVNYQVTVRTGDVRYAGTDANVYIIIHGTKGVTKKLFMDDSRDNFERGMTEVFELMAMNTGPITSITIGHDNSGPGSGWYCEDITIKKYMNREEVLESLMKMKKQKKPQARRKKRLSEKLKERELAEKDDEDDESEEDEDSDEDAKKDIKEQRYKDIFDRDGKVSKVPLYEEYYFECKNWLASDEADGLLERELQVKRKSTFYQDR